MLTLEQKPQNNVYIEGILSEVSLDMRDNFKNKLTGGTQRGITGEVRIRVPQKLNEDAEEVICEIPVNCFALEFKRNGEKNPGFESLEKVMSEYKSIAAVGEEHADKVRVSGANISVDRYMGRDGMEHKRAKVRGSFFYKAEGRPYSPRAEFTIVTVIGGKRYEVNADGEETGKYIVNGAIINWNGTVDSTEFVTSNENAIDYIESEYETGVTVKLEGKLMFTSKEIVTTAESTGFGEPIKRTRTQFAEDFVITSGSAPFDEEFSYDRAEISKGVALGNEKFKEREAEKQTKKPTAPAQTAQDLGF